VRDEQRERGRQRGVDGKLRDAEPNRVADVPRCIRVPEKLPEVRQPRPWAAQQPQRGRIPLERGEQPRERHALERNQHRQTGQRHRRKPPRGARAFRAVDPFYPICQLYPFHPCSL